ncbi:hypothetical protein [Bradyrhizobium vignae]|uniref:Uncharacterized protein n=1 Tax=Bradyrhizobium vignae TaxID=1549949 RepID=A0A2U3PUL0_9BRAD|nr:hypothetical protein [Bradyrhizobium vignae]SPP92847.1 conserved protein of unknown function [Bradyrhizobium vignae]
MKVLLIDPIGRSIESHKVESAGDIRRILGGKARTAARFPNGDRLLATTEDFGGNGFSLGGSRFVAGRAIVVGKPADFGEYARPRTDAEMIAGLVRWGAPDPEIAPHTVSAVRIDPESMVVEEVIVDSSDDGLDRALGGKARLAMRVTDSLSVFDRAGSRDQDFRWRKDSLVFRGPCLVVSHDRYGVLLDTLVTPSELGLSIEFQKPGDEDWSPWTHS